MTYRDANGIEHESYDAACFYYGIETLAASAAAEQDDDPNDRCTNPGGHEWVYTGTQYGGDDESYHGEGRCYCQWCGADGDA